MKRRSAEEYERGLAAGISDIERLEQTVHKMLTLARLEQGEKVEGLSCRIDDVVQDTVSQSSSFAALKQIEISTQLLADTSIAVDRDDALLLCSNVLINALQHGTPHTQVKIASELAGEVIRITVRDHGQGISEEDRPFVFEPFYRGDPSRSRKSGGTGLGLSICKAICDRSNGSIRIENHSDGGVLVTILLPAVTDVKHSKRSATNV